MNKIIGCMMLLFAASQSISVSALNHASESRTIISLMQVNERMIQDFTEGKMAECVIECPQGARLPFTMDVKGTFLALETSSPMYLKVLKSCYIRCEENQHFLFSTDQCKWQEFSEFFTGEVKVSVHAPNGEPVAGLELELNQRG